MSDRTTIPKTIHYFWFGPRPLPELAKRCIDSWRRYMPDYEIKLWNEDNFDVNMALYSKQAYAEKKYAFVSDYARLKILHEYGGIYLDTDVELIRSLEDIVQNGGYMGLEPQEDGGVAIATGLGMACVAGADLYKKLIASYESDRFILENGRQNLSTIVTRVTRTLQEDGFINSDTLQEIAGITVYPTDYFCPKNFTTGKLNVTANTYSIHWYDASWHPLSSRIFYALFRTSPAPLRRFAKNLVRKIKSQRK